MPKRLHQLIERITIALILLGIAGMFQPWTIDLYTWGFHVLVFSTLVYIIISHVPARENETA
jgi:hypothetical protein